MARLLVVTSQGSLVVCTGWLVVGSQDDLLVTNHHCLSKQSEVQLLQATFNHQALACHENVLAVTTDYAGDALVRTNALERRSNSGASTTRC